MDDPLILLCQIIADKLREHPQADQTALVTYLREAIAAAPDVAAALQTDPRVVQINQGDATAFQTWVGGASPILGCICMGWMLKLSRERWSGSCGSSPPAPTPKIWCG